jgi:hypothetical protein
LVWIEFGSLDEHSGITTAQRDDQIPRDKRIDDLLGNDPMFDASVFEPIFKDSLVTFRIAILGNAYSDRWGEVRIDVFDDRFTDCESLVPLFRQLSDQVLAARFQVSKLLDVLLLLPLFRKELVTQSFQLGPFGGLALCLLVLFDECLEIHLLLAMGGCAMQCLP